MSKPALATQTTLRISASADMVPERLRGAQGCPLGPLERQLVGHVDGRRSLTEIAELLALSPDETVSLAARLVELGAVRLRKTAHREIGSSEIGSEICSEIGTETDALDDGWDVDDIRARRTRPGG